MSVQNILDENGKIDEAYLPDLTPLGYVKNPLTAPLECYNPTTLTNYPINEASFVSCGELKTDTLNQLPGSVLTSINVNTNLSLNTGILKYINGPNTLTANYDGSQLKMDQGLYTGNTNNNIILDTPISKVIIDSQTGFNPSLTLTKGLLNANVAYTGNELTLNTPLQANQIKNGAGDSVIDVGANINGLNTVRIEAPQTIITASNGNIIFQTGDPNLNTRGDAIFGTFNPANQTYLNLGGFGLTNAQQVKIGLQDWLGGDFQLINNYNFGAGATLRYFGGVLNDCFKFIWDDNVIGDKTLFTINNTTVKSLVNTLQIGGTLTGVVNPTLSFNSDNGSTTSIDYNETTLAMTITNNNGNLNVLTNAEISLLAPSNLSADTGRGIQYVNPSANTVNINELERIPTNTISAPMTLYDILNNVRIDTVPLLLYSSPVFIWRYSGNTVSLNSDSLFCTADFVEICCHFNASATWNDGVQLSLVLYNTATSQSIYSDNAYSFDDVRPPISESFSLSNVKTQPLGVRGYSGTITGIFPTNPITDGDKVRIDLWGITPNTVDVFKMMRMNFRIRPVRNWN